MDVLPGVVGPPGGARSTRGGGGSGPENAKKHSARRAIRVTAWTVRRSPDMPRSVPSLWSVLTLFVVFTSVTAFGLPSRPELPPDLRLTNRGMNVAVAQHVAALAMTAETPPGVHAFVSEVLSIPNDSTAVDSILFVAFGMAFAIGYAMQMSTRPSPR